MKKDGYRVTILNNGSWKTKEEAIAYFLWKYDADRDVVLEKLKEFIAAEKEIAEQNQ